MYEARHSLVGILVITWRHLANGNQLYLDVVAGGAVDVAGRLGGGRRRHQRRWRTVPVARRAPGVSLRRLQLPGGRQRGGRGRLKLVRRASDFGGLGRASFAAAAAAGRR